MSNALSTTNYGTPLGAEVIFYFVSLSKIVEPIELGLEIKSCEGTYVLIWVLAVVILLSVSLQGACSILPIVEFKFAGKLLI